MEEAKEVVAADDGNRELPNLIIIYLSQPHPFLYCDGVVYKFLKEWQEGDGFGFQVKCSYLRVEDEAAVLDVLAALLHNRGKGTVLVFKTRTQLLDAQTSFVSHWASRKKPNAQTWPTQTTPT